MNLAGTIFRSFENRSVSCRRGNSLTRVPIRESLSLDGGNFDSRYELSASETIQKIQGIPTSRTSAGHNSNRHHKIWAVVCVASNEIAGGFHATERQPLEREIPRVSQTARRQGPASAHRRSAARN